MDPRFVLNSYATLSKDFASVFHDGGTLLLGLCYKLSDSSDTTEFHCLGRDKDPAREVQGMVWVM